MLNYNEARKIILKYGLEPATQRSLPLFTLSCLSFGYTKFIKKILKYSYLAIGAIGEEGKFNAFLNESYIVRKTEKFINNNYKKLDKVVFLPIQKILEQSIAKFSRVQNRNQPIDNLKIINSLYPRYMSAIGILNCFWRYLGNKEKKGKLTLEDIKKISKIRELVANFYPEVEREIEKITFQIGRAGKFDGDLLRYLTHSEMERYLKNKLDIKKLLPVLSSRRDGYFYLYTEKDNKEEIITDKKCVEKIYNSFFLVSGSEKKIKGFSVFKGVVRGRVLNLHDHGGKYFKKPKGGYILVASMTYPGDIYFVKHSQAIITDEGGLLCHAAIISRELKKPCIIGTKIATQVLYDGDLVEVDANKGIVKILKKS